MIVTDLPPEILRKILDFIGMPIKNYYIPVVSCKTFNKLNYHMLFVPIKIFDYFICNYSLVNSSKNRHEFIKNEIRISLTPPEYTFFEYIYDLHSIINILFFEKKKEYNIDYLYDKKKKINKSPILLLHDCYKCI